MIELFLNGLRAVIEKNTNFKMVFDNPYFTKSSTYTHDIRLPLAGCSQNQMIFRYINRADVHRSPQTLRAILIVNNSVLLNGTAVIREVTDEKVQVQLLSGNSEMNFFVSGEKYIDELKIRDWTKPVDGWIPSHETDLYFAQYPICACVCFPVYNESANEIYNRLAANYSFVSNEQVESLQSYYTAAYDVCPQPYLCYVIRSIIEGVGYRVVENQIEKTIFRDLFICNATVALMVNDILPHWTVNEFFTQLERFLGVVVVVDEGTKSVRLMMSSDFFDNTDPVYLTDVVDSFTAKIDSEETTDISNANITFSLSDSDFFKYRKLNEEDLKNIELRKYDTYRELASDLSNIDEWNRYRKIYEAEGRQYIQVKKDGRARLKEVNQFRDLIRNQENKENDIELKIVPVGMRNIEIEVFAPGTLHEGNLKWKGTVAAISMQGGVFVPFQEKNPSVEDIIENNVPEKYKSDKIEVAFNNGLKILYGGFEKVHCFPIPFVDWYDNLDGIAQNFPKWSLRFYDAPDVKCLGSEIFNKLKKINTTVEETKRFISKTIYDPKRMFIMNNKRYVCKKIEVTILSEGINELQEATMYELID